MRFLNASFKEKDAVKALGARFDFAAKKWFVPEGMDLQPFAPWLPAEASVSGPPTRQDEDKRSRAQSAQAADAGVAFRSYATDEAPDLLAHVRSGSHVPAAQRPAPASASTHCAPDTPSAISAAAPSMAPATAKGIPLSQLLANVSTAITQGFSATWVTLEIVSVRNHASGHVYLEVGDNRNGSATAKCSATIWKSAAGIVSDFETVTGARFAAGVKLLVRARPVFKAMFGFSLEIDAIDPQYTLGDLEARKREIRERLTRERVFGKNKQLPAPWDFERVLVIAPAEAAGLGDFRAEADRLDQAGICKFRYVTSRFQGDGAAREIREAIEHAMQTWRAAPDALVIIRGGGAVNDMAWLNDYDLARCICDFPVPVFTGIGHERDSCVLDEVAHTKFDTPSKVIGGIETVIRRRVQEVRENFGMVATVAARLAAAARQAAAQADQTVRNGALHQLALARQSSASLLEDVRQGAGQTLREASKTAPALLNEITASARAAVKTARLDSKAQFAAVTDRAAADVRTAYQGLDRSMSDVATHARRSTAEASDRSKALFREIAGQGPEKTLSRGFAVVRDGAGAVLTTSKVQDGTVVRIQFKDGVLRTRSEGESSE